MLLKVKEILNWAETNPPHMILIEGERISKTNLILKIWKEDVNKRNNRIKLTAWCSEKSRLKETTPHRVVGKLKKNGKIISMECSCEADPKGKCEHIVAVLIYCSKHDLNGFQSRKKMFPTGEKVLQDKEQVEKKPDPWKQCRIEPVKNGEVDVILQTTRKNTEKPIPDKLQSHTANAVCDNEETAMKIIFEEQDNKLMKKIQGIEVNTVPSCCQRTLEFLTVDCLQVCINTKKSLSSWHEERRFRITGTSCYKLATYVKNKNPNWKKKCNDHFYPRNFTSASTEYGKSMEEKARDTFKRVTGKTVFETGLVVSKLNPWLACSPDGVIFENGKPSMLLEIKCPFKGRTIGINGVRDDQVGKCLIKDEQKYWMKKKHPYYGQVQLGMTILNVRETAFVLYSDFDKKVFILTVPFDDCFVNNMLINLKSMYYNIMLHEICLINRGSQENIPQNENRQLESYIH